MKNMKIKHLLFALIGVMMAVSAPVSAQETEEKPFDVNAPHAFFGVQGGALRNYNGALGDRNWQPIGGITLGYYFTDILGLRLQANTSSWTSQIKGIGDYKSKLAAIDLDVLFNFSNLLFPYQNNVVNVIGVAGAPFGLVVPHYWVDNYVQQQTKCDRWNEGWRGGAMVEFNVAKKWAINIEGGANYIRQEDHIGSDIDRWWPYVMAGVTYKFAFGKRPNPAPIEIEQTYFEPVVEEEPVVVEEEPVIVEQPVVAEKKAVLMNDCYKKNVFFSLGKYQVVKEHAQTIDDIAETLKGTEKKATDITITGYADKGTGNARINQAISEKRAAAVKDALAKKGVDVSNVKVEGKGDTEQPFANNDDNRVVVVGCQLLYRIPGR
jgi:OOP family OmpA-OmpF porin